MKIFNSVPFRWEVLVRNPVVFAGPDLFVPKRNHDMIYMTLNRLLSGDSSATAHLGINDVP